MGNKLGGRVVVVGVVVSTNGWAVRVSVVPPEQSRFDA